MHSSSGTPGRRRVPAAGRQSALWRSVTCRSAVWRNRRPRVVGRRGSGCETSFGAAAPRRTGFSSAAVRSSGGPGQRDSRRFARDQPPGKALWQRDDLDAGSTPNAGSTPAAGVAASSSWAGTPPLGRGDTDATAHGALAPAGRRLSQIVFHLRRVLPAHRARGRPSTSHAHVRSDLLLRVLELPRQLTADSSPSCSRQTRFVASGSARDPSERRAVALP